MSTSCPSFGPPLTTSDRAYSVLPLLCSARVLYEGNFIFFRLVLFFILSLFSSFLIFKSIFSSRLGLPIVRYLNKPLFLCVLASADKQDSKQLKVNSVCVNQLKVFL